MRRNDRLETGGPATAGGARQASKAPPYPEGRQSRPVVARSLGVPSAGFATTTIAIRMVGACIVTAIGFFWPGVPLWAAGLTMLIAIVTGLRSYRAIAMASFLLWPAVLCATGLVAIGFHPGPVWVVAAIVVIGLTTLSALTGVAILAVIVTLIAVFPASPVLVLADAMPGTGLIGPIMVLVCLAIVELRQARAALPPLWARRRFACLVRRRTKKGGQAARMPGKRAADVLHRAGAIVLIAVGVVVWQLAMVAHPDTSISGSGPAAAANTIWQEMDEPRAVTERGRWIALRDMLSEGGEAIFGENFFRADDRDAIAFWCEAARQRNLTLWIGVRVDQRQARRVPRRLRRRTEKGDKVARNAIRRGAVMRFDPQSCALPDATPPIVHAAQWGIPGITGTWGRMEPLSGHSAGQADDRASNEAPADKGPASAWLICYEAFLVPAWAEALSQAATGQPPDNRPIIVLSNDGAFSGGFPTGKRSAAVPQASTATPCPEGRQSRPGRAAEPPAAIGSLPVSRLRRKVTRAMAGLTGTIVLHAETGRTFLFRAGPAAIPNANQSRGE